MNYLFVCTGNTCRSPMAEAIMAQYLKDLKDLKAADGVASAGLAVGHAALRSPNTETALRELGLSPSPGGAKPVTSDIIEWADVVLCMEERHKEAILFDYPLSKGKIKTLAAWAGQSGSPVEHDIPDPYGGTIETYREVRDEIAELIRKGLHVKND